jgi:NAD(P)H-hydrate epimerase
MSSSQCFETGYLNAQDAADLDVELMSTPGFSLEQLMELAGLSVAEAVYTVANVDSDSSGIADGNDKNNKKKRVLLVCG